MDKNILRLFSRATFFSSFFAVFILFANILCIINNHTDIVNLFVLFSGPVLIIIVFVIPNNILLINELNNKEYCKKGKMLRNILYIITILLSIIFSILFQHPLVIAQFLLVAVLTIFHLAINN